MGVTDGVTVIDVLRSDGSEYAVPNIEFSDWSQFLSFRSRRVLLRLHVDSFEKLKALTTFILIAQKNCGWATVADIAAKMKKIGLSLKGYDQ